MGTKAFASLLGFSTETRGRIKTRCWLPPEKIGFFTNIPGDPRESILAPGRRNSSGLVKRTTPLFFWQTSIKQPLVSPLLARPRTPWPKNQAAKTASPSGSARFAGMGASAKLALPQLVKTGCRHFFFCPAAAGQVAPCFLKLMARTPPLVPSRPRRRAIIDGGRLESLSAGMRIHARIQTRLAFVFRQFGCLPLG